MTETASDAELRDLLESVKTIAVVGASMKEGRPSNGVSAFLARQGYWVIPVNPAYAGETFANGETFRESLAEIDGPVDMVDIFRRSEEAGTVVDDAIRLGANAVWMQEGVIDAEAAERARNRGLRVVMDRCPAKEIPRLGLKRA